jgi:hypothetical protein
VQKAALIVLIILTAAPAMVAVDGTRITVNDYIRDSGLFVIHATDNTRPIKLLCNEDSPYCSVLKPGEYWMVNWMVPLTAYEGPYTCAEVDLYAETRDGEQGKKLGEYCVVVDAPQQSGRASPSETTATNSRTDSKSTKPPTKHQ